MSDIYKTWTFDDFMSFLLIHVAYADFQLSEEEREMLQRRIPNEKFNELKKVHSKNSDYENIQIILFFKEKFCTDKETHDKVFEEINNVFMADDEFNINEQTMNRALHLLLD